MPLNKDTLRSEYTRMWLIEDRAGPANQPAYQSLWRVTDFGWPQGDVELVKLPNPMQYGAFEVVDKVPGEPGQPNMTVQARSTFDLSDLLRIMRRGCDVDLQVHMGRCKDPMDFNRGWEKILVLEGARLTDFSISDLGALEPGDRSPVNEEVPFTGEDAYEIKPIVFAEKAESQIVQEIIKMIICDAISCGVCDDPSKGCEKVFGLTVTAVGSPGAKAEIVFSSDEGEAWGDTEIDTLAANEEPADMACVGRFVVVVSEDSNSLHYAPAADILLGTETWTEITTGFVVAGEPRAIFSLTPRHTWIVGNGGYVYFSDDVEIEVEVQDAGAATVQDLVAIHGYDLLNLVAVGNDNAVVVTRNGKTWTAVTGPAPATGLTCVWMRGKDEWFVGNDAGSLYYTRDGGDNWTEKAFPGSGAGKVWDIQFSTPTVGWLAHATAADAGRILRTIDGGYSWYVAPIGNTDIPANDHIDSVAACIHNPNLVFGGGLADDASDGIIIKGN